MKSLYSLFCFFFLLYPSLLGQIKQHIIKGSNCNVTYQSFYSGDGGELQTIKISTDQAGDITIKLFENAETFSSKNPIWEIKNVSKPSGGKLVIDFDQGEGASRVLEPNKKYCFSVFGAGNIHHSFLDDVYDGGNYRFEDGIERTGDLFFELALTPAVINNFQEDNIPEESSTQREIVIFPNPTSSSIQVNGIEADTEIGVFDNEGKLLLKQIIDPAEKLKLNHLNDGAYYLRIRSGGEVLTKKIIKTDN